MIRRPPRSTPFPYPTLSQSLAALIATQLGQTAWAGRRSPLVLATAAGSLAVLVAVVQTPGLSRFFGCRDRKSTRLNSSHANISYAVFCLKKKKNTNEH